MPAYRKLGRQPNRPHVFWILAMILTFLLVSGSKTLADTSVNMATAMEFGKVTSTAEIDGDSGVIGASVSVIPKAVPQAALPDRTVKWTRGRILKEVGKQAIEQPGHFLIGAAPIWASRHLVGVPWLGWVAAPIIAYREWLQWPSNRWWDPPLDWAFFTLGAVVATWGRRPWHGLAGGLAAIRESVASALAVRGGKPSAG